MKKVLVAISGGVDSAVAAALLKRAGFDLAGVFMRLWPGPFFSLAEKRARKTAEKLGIPFRVINFEKEFKKKVVRCFLKEYQEGRTPNPCVICNKEIKFGSLLKKAFSLKMDFLASGHYAIIKKKKDGCHLFRGRDRERDQSYFLWQLNQKQLERIFFPVGYYAKKEVRKLAEEFDLPVLEAPESREICFIKKTSNKFLKKHLREKPGKIADNRGRILGGHRGLWFYTEGQRKGIGLAGGPYYVLGKDLKKNFLLVTKNEKDLYKKDLIIKEVNWISGKEPKLPLRVKAKIRYRHIPASAAIFKQKNKNYQIRFEKPQRAVTPGQSVAIYQGQELLGGGIIAQRGSIM